MVILTASGEIVLDSPVAAAAITTTYPEPPPANKVELPWTHYGHPATGLRRRSAVVCDWIVRVRPSEIEEVKG